ncbi:MAG: hypothetical protein CMK06_07105 [Ponticaulis sp.]|nr:hypothetical protein [Ponticaulis sp.]|tara:strand:- start:61995 stop:62549 length:555 start_codon:yes stop_codon:yes gene_type:complete
MAEPTGADHAAEYGAEHAGSAFPPFEASTFSSQIFWLTISFVILYLLLSRLILPKLGGIIEQRKGKIASDLDEASRMKAEADEALAETETQLAKARADARAKAEKTRAEIDSRIADATAAKAAEIDERLGEAEERIEKLKAEHMAKVADISVATTTAILAQLGVSSSDKNVKAAVSKSVEEVSA